MRRAAKRDLNEKEIVEQLRAVPGVTVFTLNQEGRPDLLIGYRGRTYLADVKRHGGHWTPLQVAFNERWLGSPVIWAETVEEILRAIGAMS